MTDEDDEFARIAREAIIRQANCKHRWEESEVGKQYWEPGSHQHTCTRCGKMNMFTIGADHD